jgi:GNAT superfamily N-acetyltransferase
MTYLQQIRKAAIDQRHIRWTYAAGEMISYPLNGYVCEMNGMVIGNLSMIPFYWKREWYYLIANVAVHPNFRQQGIARQLTAKALDHLKRLPIHAVWLHVREDNLPARHLYDTFQFTERCMRDTWVSSETTDHLDRPTPGVQIDHVRPEDWPDQSKWLSNLYPPDVTWNLGFDVARFRPGILGYLRHFFYAEEQNQWAARIDGAFSGAAILHKSLAYADQVYLSIPADANEKVITRLLPFIKYNFSPKRQLLVNFPSRFAENAFLQSGFILISRLIWMEIKVT